MANDNHYDATRKAYGQIMAKAWKDEAFAQRFKNDPKAVLKEHGIDVPEGTKVHVHQTDGNEMHLQLPKKPAEVSDEHLSAVAGGSCVGTGGSLGTAGCPTSTAGCAGTAGSA